MIGSGWAGLVYRDRVEMGPAPAAMPVTQNESPLLAQLGGKASIDERQKFFQLLDLVDRYYVEEVSDKEKLAVGAVRGMVTGLWDSRAQFLDKDQYTAYKGALGGELQGVGAEVRYRYDEVELNKFRELRKKMEAAKSSAEMEIPEDYDPSRLVPDLVVTYVAPNSPAAREGLKAGDVIDKIDGKRVISSRFRKELDEMFSQIRRGDVDPEKLAKLRKEYRDNIENSLIPARALDKLTVEKGAALKVTWLQGGNVKVPMTKTIGRSSVKASGHLPVGGNEVVQFWDGADALLAKAITGKSKVTLDLRGVSNGTLSNLRACLGVLLPSGTYGAVKNPKTGVLQPFKIDGKPGDKPSNIELITDATTQGNAAIFGQALLASGKARIIEGPPLPKDQPVVELIELQDGSAYLLPIGFFSSEVTK